ncbi:hypothetical protein NX84_07135 [Corynebacterium minutissimum]|nr:hypothetical protein NX84_07135 [Corynebacterium minutissimum]
MTQSPITLPRTKLKLSPHVPRTLAAQQSTADVSQPNPHMDRSGVREIIDGAGPSPGRALLEKNSTGLITGILAITVGIIGLAIAVAAYAIWAETKATGPIVLICLLVFIALTAFIVAASIRGKKSLNRIAESTDNAWINGWIEYRPVLIGELAHVRQVDDGDTVTHYYTAPLLMLQPDGTMHRVPTYEFIYRDPAWLKAKNFAVADSPQTATVDFAHNNGWDVAGYRVDVPNPKPQFGLGLTKQQVDAVLSFAEQNWVR